MAGQNNRLVQRYQPPNRVEIMWTAEDRSKKRTKRTPQTTTVTAAIIDVSVNGMFVELPLDPIARVGDEVALSSDENIAAARVVRALRDEEQSVQLVGVEIVNMSAGFAADLNAVVGSLRGDRGQLAEWWARS